MEDKIITTRRGVFGRLQVTLPIKDKMRVLARVKASGMGKSEYLQKALILGVTLLEQEHNHDGGELAPQPART